jgi:branched-chain amino acid transport system permease protein
MTAAATVSLGAARAPRSSRSLGLVIVAVLAAVYIAVPLVISHGFWLKVLIYSGIAALGAIGLNLLTGNTGQVSLGHPFFLGTGAYVAAYVGQNLGFPLPVWMAAAIIAPALVGAIVGPFALRLRGHYLVMVTFALVFIGLHIFSNWEAVTGGTAGRQVKLPLSIGPADLASLPGMSRDQGFFLLVWGCVGVTGVMVWNLGRSRVGRALMAIRDREVTAEVVGIAVARYKVAAFVISSGIAGLAGGLYAAFTQFVSPTEWGLLLGVQYLAMIVVGGIGSVAGSILGALVITILPFAVQAVSSLIPLISQNPSDGGIITAFALNQILFGVIIIVFLMRAPRGLSGAFEALASKLRTVRRP